MKKKELKLSFNKSVISKLEAQQITGGRAPLSATKGPNGEECICAPTTPPSCIRPSVNYCLQESF